MAVLFVYQDIGAVQAGEFHGDDVKGHDRRRIVMSSAMGRVNAAPQCNCCAFIDKWHCHWRGRTELGPPTDRLSYSEMLRLKGRRAIWDYRGY